MLGNMQAIEAAAIVHLGQLEAPLVKLGEAEPAAVEMVENTEFHAPAAASLLGGPDQSSAVPRSARLIFGSRLGHMAPNPRREGKKDGGVRAAPGRDHGRCQRQGGGAVR